MGADQVAFAETLTALDPDNKARRARGEGQAGHHVAQASGVRIVQRPDRLRDGKGLPGDAPTVRGKDFDEGAISQGERGRSWPER